MIEALVPLFACTFTVQEIEQVAAFHASPVCKKSLAAMPRLMAEGMKIGESIMLPRINAAMSDVSKNVKNRRRLASLHGALFHAKITVPEAHEAPTITRVVPS